MIADLLCRYLLSLDGIEVRVLKLRDPSLELSAAMARRIPGSTWDDALSSNQWDGARENPAML